MKRFLFLWLCCVAFRPLCAEEGRKSLADYVATARANSPLMRDFSNQTAMEKSELARLKALYMHSRLELNGDYLFVPVVVKSGGRTVFKWNAQDATDYLGYDLGESSGHLHAGVTWTQPLLGRSDYRTAQEQARVNTETVGLRMRMEAQQLERSVTEQYLLCLLDRRQTDFADSIARLLDCQAEMLRKMVREGLSKRSEIDLLSVEQAANEELRIASSQSYHTHLMELNLLCGINDTTDVVLPYISLKTNRLTEGDGSLFTAQFRLDSLETANALRDFNRQYKPRLDLFINGGVQTGAFNALYRHLGWSAGLTFSWTLFDGKQRRRKEQQAAWRWNTITAYKDRAALQRETRLKACLSEMAAYDKREKALEKQVRAYEEVLSAYGKEIKSGQTSVLDYVTVLRNKIQTTKDLLLLQTNRELAVAAYNYWSK